MIQGCCGPSFLLEAAKAVRVGAERFRQNLDGDVAAQPRVTRVINLPMPPLRSGRITSYGPSRAPTVNDTVVVTRII